MGKLLLAEFDDDRLRRWVATHGLKSFTRSTIVDSLALRRELAQVRRRGVATDRGEYDAAFGSLAAPILNSAGESMGAIAITVTRQQLAADQSRFEIALLSVTRQLSEAHVV